MNDVLEVRPGEVPAKALAERVLEPVRRVGQTPRLIGPDGTTIELPEGIHELLVSIVEHLWQRGDRDPDARRVDDGRGR